MKVEQFILNVITDISHRSRWSSPPLRPEVIGVTMKGVMTQLLDSFEKHVYKPCGSGTESGS